MPSHRGPSNPHPIEPLPGLSLVTQAGSFLRHAAASPELQLQLELIRFMLSRLEAGTAQDRPELAATLASLCRAVAHQVRSTGSRAIALARALDQLADHLLTAQDPGRA